MSGNKKEEALIHVQGLGKSFGAVDVLKDISVDINKGDVVFVIGLFRLRKEYFPSVLKPSGGAHQRPYFL